MAGRKFKLFILSTPLKPLLNLEKPKIVVYNSIISNYEKSLSEPLND